MDGGSYHIVIPYRTNHAVCDYCTCPFDIAAHFMPHTMCNLDVLLSLCVAFVLTVFKLITQYYSF
jgi:hypothetical protein